MNEPRPWTGIALGLAASLTWGIYNVGAEVGQASGFRPADLTLLRYSVAAILLTPFVLRTGSQRPGLRKIIVLALLVGPIFAMLFNAGFQRAPLSHAVVLGPGMSMLVANFLASVAERRPPSVTRITGIGLLLCGLLLIAIDTPSPKSQGLSVLAGDLCFILSGSLWGCYVFLMGKWRLPPVRTTGAIALLSSATFLPFYIAVWGFPVMPSRLWAEQIFYQGVVGGALAFIIFATAVLRLGAGRAALFSALVPPAAVLMAIPMTGQFPTALQWSSVVIATSGLIVSLDLRRSVAARRKQG